MTEICSPLAEPILLTIGVLGWLLILLLRRFKYVAPLVPLISWSVCTVEWLPPEASESSETIAESAGCCMWYPSARIHISKSLPVQYSSQLFGMLPCLCHHVMLRKGVWLGMKVDQLGRLLVRYVLCKSCTHSSVLCSVRLRLSLLWTWLVHDISRCGQL